MKKKILLLTIFAFATLFTAKAQMFGGNDVLVSYDLYGTQMEPKISVANNGWIYILEYNAFFDGWKLHRSQDNGVTYQKLSEYVKSGFKLKSCDFVVTGENQSDIAIWITSLYDKIGSSSHQSTAYIAKYNSEGKWIKNVFSRDFNNVIQKHVSISTDYRSPQYDNFYIVMATTNYSTFQKKSAIDVVYSNNGGESFTSKNYFQEDGDLGRIDISIGSQNNGLDGRVGIVFEIDNFDDDISNIGFFATNNQFAYKWDNPVRVNMKKPNTEQKCGFPKIQWVQNKDLNSSTSDFNYNFLIAFHENSKGHGDYDLMFVYPKKSFDLKIGPNPDPVLDDFGFYVWNDNKHAKYPDLSYDKAGNNYLLTYIWNEDHAMYRYTKFSKINNVTWSTIGSGVYSERGPAFPYSFPVVDINPTKVKACFAFIEDSYYDELTSLYADAEWSTVDVDEHEVAVNKIFITPNPATDNVKIQIEEIAIYTGHIHNMQGKEIKRFTFTGTETIFDVNDFPSGMYLITLKTDKKQYKGKLIVK